MIMNGMARVAAAMTWLVNEGTMCRKMMRRSVAPATLAAFTNSSSRSARKRPRTTRPSSVHARSEMMTVMEK